MYHKHLIEDDIDIVSLAGRLGMADAAEAREQFKTIIEQSRGHLIVDLGDLKFIDSSGLSVLVFAFKAVRGKDGRIVLSNISAEILSLIELTRLNEIFEIYADTGAALAAMKTS